MRISKRAALFLSLTMLFASCSSDGDNPGFGPGASPDTGEIEQSGPTGEIGSGSEADLEAAATAAFAAFSSADDQTYFNLLSRECRDLQFAAVESHLVGRRFRIDTAGIAISALGVGAVEIGSFDSSSATVTLTISGTDEQFIEGTRRRWIFEDDGWKLDECSEITPAQGGLAGAGTERSNPLVLGGIADLDGWLVSLGFISTDSESDVLDLGGSPAPEGGRMVVAQVGLTYIGVQPLVTLGDSVAFAMVNGSTVYGDEASCESDNDIFVDLNAEAGPGDTLNPMWVCRIVRADDADQMLLRVTLLPAGTEYWFDLSGS